MAPRGAAAAAAAVLLLAGCSFGGDDEATPQSSVTSADSVTADVSCTGRKGRIRRGSNLKVVYEVKLSAPTWVGLGARIYDGDGGEFATGHGDVRATPASSGTNELAREIRIPSDLPSGSYRVIAQVWRPNEIGYGKPLAQGTCFTFKL